MSQYAEPEDTWDFLERIGFYTKEEVERGRQIEKQWEKRGLKEQYIKELKNILNNMAHENTLKLKELEKI